MNAVERTRQRSWCRSTGCNAVGFAPPRLSPGPGQRTAPSSAVNVARSCWARLSLRWPFDERHQLQTPCCGEAVDVGDERLVIDPSTPWRRSGSHGGRRWSPAPCRHRQAAGVTREIHPVDRLHLEDGVIVALGCVQAIHRRRTQMDNISAGSSKV